MLRVQFFDFCLVHGKEEGIQMLQVGVFQEIAVLRPDCSRFTGGPLFLPSVPFAPVIISWQFVPLGLELGALCPSIPVPLALPWLFVLLGLESTALYTPDTLMASSAPRPLILVDDFAG